MSLRPRSHEYRKIASIAAVLFAGALSGRSANLLPEPDARMSAPKSGTLVPLAPLVFRTSDSPFDAGVNNQGWWSATLANNDHNDNYAVGNTSLLGGAPVVRAFFTFDLGSLDLSGRTIVSALLQVDRGNRADDPTETFTLFDVSTDAATLNDNTGTSEAIFEDLGSGTVYGSYTVVVEGPQYGRGAYRLNQAAIAGITAAAGEYFSIGGALQSLPGYVFGGTGGPGDQRLVLCLDTDLDTDGDGICDGADNCPTADNPEQEDYDGDAIGDVCDDSDEDGIVDALDNCPLTQNPDQADGDGDGLGDVCDFCIGPGELDSDGDGSCDDADNCPFDVNADQADGDGDAAGDVCDNCPEAPNPDQADSDGNGVGDVCEGCLPSEDDDGDNVCDDVDNCPSVPNANQADDDNNGVGDACAQCELYTDHDGDDVCDDFDNCPAASNSDQADADEDGFGNACDVCFGWGGADSDLDGLCDPIDDCPFVSDPGQSDSDGDGSGDVCDNCPAVFNVNQANADSDVFGDCCDPCPDDPSDVCGLGASDAFGAGHGSRVGVGSCGPGIPGPGGRSPS